MKPLYIFDLDGTLALIEHRRKYVERPRGEQDWKAFYTACVDDRTDGMTFSVAENELRAYTAAFVKPNVRAKPPDTAQR
jgi:hypothetical protein